MKTYLYLIGCLSVVFACKNDDRKQYIASDCGVVVVNIPELVDSLQSYYRQNLAREKGVIIVDFQNENDTSIFIVSSIMDRGSVMNNPPSNYLVINGFPVLLYSGIEKNLIFDSLYLANFHRRVDPLLEEYIEDEERNVIQIPPNYNPVVWKIKVVARKIVKTEIIN